MKDRSRATDGRGGFLLDRRGFGLGAMASLIGMKALAQGGKAELQAAPTKIVLLGTKGGPRVGGARSNPANLLMIGDTPIVIDCGYGVARQLVLAGVPLTKLRYIFLSHQHSDHNLEYGNLFYGAWAAGFKGRVDAYGPPGTRDLTADFFRLNRIDIETRMADEGKKDPRSMLVATEIDKDGPVMQTDQVRVTAMRTPHPPMTDLAYRFETAAGTVVFSGDTAYNPALADFAHGADVLVHEAIHEPSVDKLVAKVPNAATFKQHLLASHTTTEDVGRIAAQAKVKLLVLSHLVPGDIPITDEMWLEGVRKSFTGRAIVGRDLMEIPLPLT